jgi:hypothetical protein
MNICKTAYRGIGPESGRYISPDNALPYAMKRCGICFSSLPGDFREEFTAALVEWFYSGDWLPVDTDEEAARWS